MGTRITNPPSGFWNKRHNTPGWSIALALALFLMLAMLIIGSSSDRDYHAEALRAVAGKLTNNVSAPLKKAQ